MNPADLSSQPSPWINQPGPDFEIVISSRVRLARNLEGYEFKPCLSAQRQNEILEILTPALLSLDQKLYYIDVDKIAAVERELLAERYLISPAHVRGKGPRGVAIAEEENFSAMINEEDHLRMQAYAPGLQLKACLDRVNQIDDQIEKKVRFAFHPRFGYLTACPTNLGTGIRVSVMLHLPGLKMTGQIDKFFAAARDCNLAVRGAFGEGSETVGDFYQLSNQVTLGVAEAEVVSNFTEKIVPKIVEYERAARQTLIEQSPYVVDDKIQRALGVLRNARLISSQEALVLLSQVRLGVHIGRIFEIQVSKINNLFFHLQPAHLQMRAGKSLDPDQRDSFRAQVIRKALSPN
jgi:protein arginine kinase